MDTLLQAILSWQFLIFCLAIFAITFVLRTIVEYFISNYTSFTKEAKLWNQVVLPILPILIGAVSAVLAKQYPFPEDLHSISGRLAFGLVAGLSCGPVYKLYNALLSSKISELFSKINAVTGVGAKSREDEDPGASVRDTINKE